MPSLPLGACALPRQALLFARIDLKGVPRSQWRESIALELEASAPYKDANGWYVRDGERALVWYWPRTLEQQIHESLGDVTLVPETAMWPVLADGQYRYVCDDESGLFLLQYQHPTLGLFERREVRPISPDEARAWLGRQQASITAPLEPTLRPSIDKDSQPRGEPLVASTSLLESRVLPMTCAALAVVVAIFLVANLRASWEVYALKRSQQEIKAEVQSVLAKRDQVRLLSQFNRALTSMRQPSHLELARDIGDTLQLDDTMLRQWSYRGGQLTLMWHKQPIGINAATIVRSLEELPALSNVQAETPTNQHLAIVNLNVATNDTPGSADD